MNDQLTEMHNALISKFEIKAIPMFPRTPTILIFIRIFISVIYLSY